MPDYLGAFLNSLAQSNQMGLAQQAAVRQQQELELEKQKQQNAQQVTLAELLGQGAQPVSNGQIQAPAPQPTLSRGDDGSLQSSLSLGGPTTSMAADPSRGTVSIGGQQLQIETPDERNASDTAQAVSRATALNKIGKVPLSAEGSAAMGGLLPAGTPIDPAHAAYLGTIFAANKRAESAQNKLDAQPAKKLVGHSVTTDDNGKQFAVKFFDDGTTQTEPLSSRGQTRQYADDRGAKAGAKAATQNALLLEKRAAIRDYEAATKEENDLNATRLRLGAALKTGQHYIDKRGNLKSFDSEKLTPEQITAQHEDMRAQYEQATNRLVQVAAQKNDAIERAGGHPSVSAEEVAQRLRAGHAHNMNVALNPAPPEQPQAPPAAPAKPAATVAASKYSVGQTIQYKGKPHIVKGINPDGSLQIAPAGS